MTNDQSRRYLRRDQIIIEDPSISGAPKLINRGGEGVNFGAGTAGLVACIPLQPPCDPGKGSHRAGLEMMYLSFTWMR